MTMTNVPRRRGGTGGFVVDDVIIVDTETETDTPDPTTTSPSPRHVDPAILARRWSPRKSRRRRYLVARRHPPTSSRLLVAPPSSPTLLLLVFVAFLIHLTSFADVPMTAGFTFSSAAPRPRPASSTTVPVGGWCLGRFLGLRTTGPHLWPPPLRHDRRTRPLHPFVLAAAGGAETDDNEVEGQHWTRGGPARSSSLSLDSLDDRTVPTRHSDGDEEDREIVTAVNGDGGGDGVLSSENTNTLLFGRVARLLEGMPMQFPTTSKRSSSSSSSQKKPLYVERVVGGGDDSGGGTGGGGNGGAATSVINLKLVTCGRNFAGRTDGTMADEATDEDHSRSSSPLPVLVSPPTKVPGCVATVHVRTTLVPVDRSASARLWPHSTVEGEDDSVGDGIGGSRSGSASTTRDPHRYGVVLDGTADAALSRGLLSLLSASFGPDVSSLRRTFGGAGTTIPGDTTSSGGDEDEGEDETWFPTAADVLEVDPDRAAELLGLRDVLSRGRNDGVASLVRVVQDQVRSLLLSSEPSHPEPPVTATAVIEGVADHIAIGETTAKANGVTPKVKEGERKKVKVAMLLSGGVDSSVALALLASDPTYDVTAFYLRIWLEDELSHLGQCPWEDDWNTCRQVCKYVGRRIAGMDGPIPLQAVSMQEEYVDAVLGYTLDEARRGRTPNPDVWCNARIKFGCFYDAVTLRSTSPSPSTSYSSLNGEVEGDDEEEGFDYVATGHYASVVPVTDDDGQGGGDECDDGRGRRRVRLLRAPDPVKDQTYFLSALSQDQLSRAMFPLGNYTKAEVRELADRFGLPNRDRPDSQGLCFLGKVKFDDFLGSYLGERMGDVVDADTGDVIGRHRGLWFHTVGQRKGLGKVLFPLRTAEGPWYVVAKDPERNALFASNRYNDVDGNGDGGGTGVGADEGDALATARLECHVEDVRWISGMEPAHLFSDGNCFDGDSAADAAGHGGGRVAGRLGMKVRHGPTIVEGWLELLREDDPGGDGYNSSCGRIRLDSRDGGLAPGQFVAFYEPDGGTECLGSAVISERHWARFLASGSGALRYGRGHAG